MIVRLIAIMSVAFSVAGCQISQRAETAQEQKALGVANEFMRKKAGREPSSYELHFFSTEDSFIFLYGLREGEVGGEPLIFVDKRAMIVTRYCPEQ